MKKDNENCMTMAVQTTILKTEDDSIVVSSSSSSALQDGGATEFRDTINLLISPRKQRKMSLLMAELKTNPTAQLLATSSPPPPPPQQQLPLFDDGDEQQQQYLEQEPGQYYYDQEHHHASGFVPSNTRRVQFSDELETRIDAVIELYDDDIQNAWWSVEERNLRMDEISQIVLDTQMDESDESLPQLENIISICESYPNIHLAMEKQQERLDSSLLSALQKNRGLEFHLIPYRARQIEEFVQDVVYFSRYQLSPSAPIDVRARVIAANASQWSYTSQTLARVFGITDAQQQLMAN